MSRPSEVLLILTQILFHQMEVEVAELAGVRNVVAIQGHLDHLVMVGQRGCAGQLRTFKGLVVIVLEFKLEISGVEVGDD